MTKLLLALVVSGARLALMSRTTKGVALAPLTETERQGLGTIGIAAEMSKLDTWYAQEPSLFDEGLRGMQDHRSGARQGAIDGVKSWSRSGTINLSCRHLHRTECLGEVLG